MIKSEIAIAITVGILVANGNKTIDHLNLLLFFLLIKLIVILSLDTQFHSSGCKSEDALILKL